MMLLMTMMMTGKIVRGVLICHRMDTVEMIMMANSKEGGQSGTI